MAEDAPDAKRLTTSGGRPLRVGHLTTVDMSLALLLGTELAVDIEQGFEVFGISAPGPYVPRVEALGVTHVPLTSLTRAWDPRRDAAAFGELVRVLRRLKLDVLHTHNPKTGVLGRIAGRLARVPVVVNTCHGLWAPASGNGTGRALSLGMEACAARFSHAELYQNATDRAALAAFVPSRRSRVVGNGVDLERFVRDPEGRRRLRAQWGIGDDELLVGGVGRRVAEKGIVEFTQTARALSGRARFVWVGPEDEDKSDALTGGDDAVLFAGAIDDMPAVYSALDVFALPSYREGFSRSAMEAAACGTPMVLTDIRGCREVGRHEQELLLVPAGSAPALTAAVGRLLDDEVLRRSLAAAASAKAAKEFDQRAVAAVSVATYAAVARRRGLGWTGGLA